METFLAIDTTSVPFSVAIGNKEKILGEEVNFERTALAGSITRMIERCCKQAGTDLQHISAIIIARGPGSYTGLRIGYSVAKGLCMALGIPLIEADALEAMALEAARKEGGEDSIYCTALDARRNEVYMSLFDFHGKTLHPVTACVLPVELETLTDKTDPDKIYCSGDGAQKVLGQLGPYKYCQTNILNMASNLLQLSSSSMKLSSFAEIAGAEPLYLKPPNITVSKKPDYFS